MGIIIFVVFVFVILLAIFYISKTSRKHEAESDNQKRISDQASEKMMRPEKKLHEEEKKRWENEYWKNQEKRAR